MKNILIAAVMLWGGFVSAQDVLVIGEIHDNPHHHELQAEKVAELAPKALVLEMVAAGRAYGEVMPQFRHREGLAEYLGWDASGWPDFSMYDPIFRGAPDARIYGAQVSRDVARQSMSEGMTTSFGEGAEAFGLTEALPAEEQKTREALQAAAHCDALPEEMLAPMVEIQRLRDAVLARAVVQAVADTGGPVAVITGNGHARRDWGVPAVLERAAPDLDVYVIGQTEADQPLPGGFDEIISAPPVDRTDPCHAFQ